MASAMATNNTAGIMLGWSDTFSASRRKELVGSFVHAAGSALIARIFRGAVDVTAVLDKTGISVQWGGASGELQRQEAAACPRGRHV
jgi:hypothetical protein